ncbi:LysR family transcriptional regulator [Aestuariimicrobium soli]|uniref:LysR family transcriptional regulator n=1 Tax=Aestuariimicrobium soli TaxID=2035834 RepID=UPI003EB6D91C
MDVRRLLIFRSVLRAGSISAGARDLGWTQPAVSQHLQALERELRTPLLLRGPRGVEPTQAGLALARHADAIAARLSDAEAEVAELKSLGVGLVRLSAFPSGAAVHVPPALARLAARAPGVDVRLQVEEPPEALARLRAGECDLALVFDHPDDGPASSEADLRSIPVVVEDLVMVVPGDRRVVEGVDLSAFADEAWIAGCVRCRQHLLVAAGRAGFAPDIRHETDDYVVVQGMVAHGLGVALLPRTALQAFHHPGVQVVEVVGAGRRALSLVHRLGAERVPAVAALVAAFG